MVDTRITLHTETTIDSCHRLENYNGKCSRLHGHTWKLEIWIQGFESQKDHVGILFDFSNIKKIQEELDHYYINENVPYFSISYEGKKINPTAENLSRYILNKLTGMNGSLEYRVKLFETAIGKETWCQIQTAEFDGGLI